MGTWGNVGSGAALGATMGTMVPGVGTLVGAGVGGALGLGASALSALGIGGGDDTPQLQADPYAKYYNDLIAQLRSNNGPSLAAQQYNQANQQAINNMLMMSHGRGAGAARQAQMGMGQAGQGLAAGSAMAATRERMAQQQQLLAAIQAASGSQFQRDSINLQMRNAALSRPTDFQQGMSVFGQGLQGAAMISRGQQDAARADAESQARIDESHARAEALRNQRASALGPGV